MRPMILSRVAWFLRSRRFPLAAALGSAVAMALAAPASAQDVMDVPVAIQVPLIVKVLTFDRQLKTRAGAQLVVAVAYQGGNRGSVMVKDEIVSLLGAERESIAGLPITAVAIDLDREPIGKALQASHASVLYMTPVRGVDLAQEIGRAHV